MRAGKRLEMRHDGNGHWASALRSAQNCLRCSGLHRCLLIKDMIRWWDSSRWAEEGVDPLVKREHSRLWNGGYILEFCYLNFKFCICSFSLLFYWYPDKLKHWCPYKHAVYFKCITVNSMNIWKCVYELCVCMCESGTVGLQTAPPHSSPISERKLSAGFLPHTAELLSCPLTNQHDKSQLQVFYFFCMIFLQWIQQLQLQHENKRSTGWQPCFRYHYGKHYFGYCNWIAFLLPFFYLSAKREREMGEGRGHG